MPPMLEQITGLPLVKASWITTGEFSHQVEGITIASIPCISALTWELS